MGYNRKGGADKLNVGNVLVCEVHCNPEVDRHLSEKDKLIKTQNTSREQTNQLISHIKIITKNFQNLENNINPIKTKTKSTDKYPGIKKCSNLLQD